MTTKEKHATETVTATFNTFDLLNTPSVLPIVPYFYLSSERSLSKARSRLVRVPRSERGDH
jgi:hypothetical protein